jgi:hypothetical protein
MQPASAEDKGSWDQKAITHELKVHKQENRSRAKAAGNAAAPQCLSGDEERLALCMHKLRPRLTLDHSGKHHRPSSRAQCLPPMELR